MDSSYQAAIAHVAGTTQWRDRQKMPRRRRDSINLIAAIHGIPAKNVIADVYSQMSARVGLSPQGQAFLMALREHVETTGSNPTAYEMQALLAYRSVNSIYTAAARLAAHGLIIFYSGNCKQKTTFGLPAK